VVWHAGDPKGWIDRVFAVGRAYGNRRWFDVGVFRESGDVLGHRRWPANVCSERGINGPDRLDPVPDQSRHTGFTGFTVVDLSSRPGESAMKNASHI